MRQAWCALLAATALLAACHPAPPPGPAPRYELATVLAGLQRPRGLAAGPEGLYVSTDAGLSLVGPEGQPRVLAPVGPQLRSTAGVALATGSVFVADPGGHRVWSLVGDGPLEVFAGSGTNLVPIGDGGLAVSAQLDAPMDVEVGSKRNLFIADAGQHRVRQVDAEGRITTVVGDGVPRYAGDGGPAKEASLHAPEALCAAPDGSLYIADTGNHVVRRVDPEGRISTVAGTGTAGFAGDGGPAIQSQLASPSGLTLLPSGDLLVADAGNHRIRWVHPGGIIQSVVGRGAVGSTDEGPAADARLSAPGAIAITPDGSPFFVDPPTGRIYQLRPVKEATASPR